MNFTTPIQIPPSRIRIGYQHRTMVLGSCFAEAIGERLADTLFPVDVNPFGILHNPMSIAAAIRRLIDGRLFTAAELIRHDNMYHSLLHHGSFSAPTAEECLEQINARLSSGSQFLTAADRIIVTFGTAYVYRWKTTNDVVSNCHKLPESYFHRSRLSIDRIAHTWILLMDSVNRLRPDLKWVFTVSPVRHLRDGAHENHLSKATLLFAIEKILARYPTMGEYFPAYELLLDELRDYRFYSADMCHPSPLAAYYISERFEKTYMDSETRAYLRRAEALHRDLQHKPFRPDSEAYRGFLAQTKLKLEQLRDELPLPPTFAQENA